MRLVCRVIAIITCLALGATATAQGLKRPPAPAESELASATKLVVDLYQKDIDAAKTPAAQKALAYRLFDDAVATKDDPAARFAMLQYSRTLATKTGEVKLAMLTIDQQNQAYEIDRAQLRSDLLQSLAPLSKSTLERFALIRLLTVDFLELKKNERLDLATELSDLALELSKNVNDADLIKQWKRRVFELKAQLLAKAAQRQALATLQAQPADAAANQIAGEYLCYWLNQWEQGLTMLALGDNPALQKLAEREIRGPVTAAEQLALADAWYDLGKTQTAQAKLAMLDHAGKLYDRLLPTQAALAKKRIENRSDEIAFAVRPIPKNEWVELLDLVDPQVHSKKGPWKRDILNVKVNYDDVSTITLPVVINGSFEIQVRATRHSGPDQFYVDLSRAGHSAAFILNCWAGEISGLDHIKDKGPKDNATSKAPISLPNGQMYLMALQWELREAQCGLAVRVNDKPYISWSGLTSDLGEPGRGQGMDLTTWKTDFVLHSIRLRVKSDDAWFTE